MSVNASTAHMLQAICSTLLNAWLCLTSDWQALQARITSLPLAHSQLYPWHCKHIAYHYSIEPLVPDEWCTTKESVTTFAAGAVSPQSPRGCKGGQH